MFDHYIDDNVEWVPASLDSIPPGAVLAAMLDDIDVDRCSGFDQIRVLRAHQRMRSHYAARSYRAMTNVVETMRQDPDEADFAEQAATAEVAAALRLTRRSADLEMELALELRQRLPQVWEALCDGAIDVHRARVLVAGTVHLSMAAARQVVATVITDAARLTTGQLGARLRKLCIKVDPDDAKDRYRRSVKDRRIATQPNVDGTANLHLLNVPPHRAAAASQRINRMALHHRSNGDTRTMDQLRADIALDILEGTAHGAIAAKGSLNMTSDLTSLAGLADHPGDLAGYGPVIADIARQAAEQLRQAEWRWTLIDPDSSQPIAGGITRRRPTAAQRRYVQTCNPTCVHPGCRMPATDCDIDHTIPWSERYITNTDDLAPLCRHHHTIRHQAGWTYTKQPDGDHIFTSALGHTYTTSGRSP